MKKLLLFIAFGLSMLSAAAQGPQKASVRKNGTATAIVPRVVETRVDGTFTVDFEITSANFDIRGFQVEIDMPRGVFVQEAKLSDRVTNAKLSKSAVTPTLSGYALGSKLMANSRTGAPLTIEGNVGKVLTVKFGTNEEIDYGNSNIGFTLVRLTPQEGQSVKVSDFTVPVNFVTIHGDVNRSFGVDADDVKELANIIVNKSQRTFSPEGNIDCSDNVNDIVDLTRLIDYLQQKK